VEISAGGTPVRPLTGNQLAFGPLLTVIVICEEKSGQRRMQNLDVIRASRRRRFSMAINDPRPVATVSGVWRTAVQCATIGIFIILLIAALDLARPIFLPAASAFVVTMMLGPLSERAERYRIPTLVTAIVLWLLVITVFYGVIVLLSAPAVDWIGKAPDISRVVQEKLRLLDRPLAALQDLRNALLPSDTKGGLGFDIMSIVQPAVTVVTPAIGEVFIFFGTLFFMLLGRTRLRRVLVAFFDDREARLRKLKIMNDIEHNLTGYLSMVTLINFAVGIAAGIIAFAVGLPDPIAWAVLGFILNFIPYIGALLMEAGLFFVGLVTFPALAHVLVAPLVYAVFAALEGHFITPSIVGRRLTLNPLTVFLSLVFWTWLWGPIGAFLAVPLLIMALVAVSHLFPNDEPALPD
jgi:predicted PurR-regulated permease PerM